MFRVTAHAEMQGARPSIIEGQDFVALRDMLRCVSPDVGPILRVSSFLGSGDNAGGGYAGHAELYDMDGLLRDTYMQRSIDPGVNDTLFGGGKGPTLAAAMLSTVGEAVERAVAGMVGCSPHLPGPRLIGSYENMVAEGYPALRPETIRLFSNEQYESPGFLYARFEPDTVVQWVEAKRMVSAEPVWVPAQLVDMIHIYDPSEEIVGYPVSGGLSCHTSTEAAAYHGLTEVIERDAINLSWYTDAPPCRLAIDDDVRRLAGPFLERLELDHTDSCILYHPSDVTSASTFSVVGFQRWLTKRQYCAGGGADASAVTALGKAIAEFGQTRATLTQSVLAPRSSVGQSVERLFDWQLDRPLAEMSLFFQAIGYYGLEPNSSLLESYLSGPEISLGELRAMSAVSETTDLGDRLRGVLSDLSSCGIDPIVLDYSHPDWSRLSIVKIFVPELTTPFLQSRPMLGHPRLTDMRPAVMLGADAALPLPYP